jgi:hypothetical protein
MKVLKFALCFGLVALGAAWAQIISPVDFSMDTSFAVGNTNLPAGKYEIIPTDELSVLELRGVKGTPSVFFDVEPLESLTPFKKTELVFNRYGDKLVLKSIMVEGETTGATSITGTLEKRHRKAFGAPTKVTRPATKRKK